MLFDLQGKRRRVVQATYLTLAVLMGGGLVFFGIGGDVSGGLADAFKDGGGGGDDGNQLIEERVERNEEIIRRNPRSEGARKALTRDYYQLAVAQISEGSNEIPDGAREDLNKAAANWRAYLALEPKRPDESLAATALQIFGPQTLNRPKQAQQAAAMIAEARSDSESYLNLVQYATLAGDKRTADLAGQRAVDLAPKAEKKTVRDQLKQLEAQAAAGAAQGGAAQQQDAGG